MDFDRLSSKSMQFFYLSLVANVLSDYQQLTILN